RVACQTSHDLSARQPDQRPRKACNRGGASILRRNVAKGYAPNKKYCAREAPPFVYFDLREPRREPMDGDGSPVRSEKRSAMSAGSERRGRPLTLVTGAVPEAADSRVPDGSVEDAAQALDWSILMAHAQAGEQAAYRRLLKEVSPYVRSLAAKCHRDPRDVED